jgi:prophage regulatory protein
MKMGKHFGTFVLRFHHSQLPKVERHKNRKKKMVDYNERLIREEECKLITGLSRATRHRWHKAGKFPAPIRINGRVTVWKHSALMQWIEQNCAQV